jgi:hypothetical protein
VLGAAPAGERGEGQRGDFGVGDPALFVGVVDRVGVADGGPRLFVDAGDGPGHRWGQACGEGESGPGPPRRGGDVIAVKR